jgi:hypothetical protein
MTVSFSRVVTALLRLYSSAAWVRTASRRSPRTVTEPSIGRISRLMLGLSVRDPLA